MPLSQVYTFLKSLEDNEEMTLSSLLDVFKEPEKFRDVSIDTQKSRLRYPAAC
ncbi:hypothetical protein [Endozoicomonas ascidiicola]|uniref:hypothetical protein n=1 Tax=Endozoicomonas ascidiicola TaxID=1698521 RepID=UPI000A42F99B|nr:hypothetical protein [Endozoicomonas ascidiicola]